MGGPITNRKRQSVVGIQLGTSGTRETILEGTAHYTRLFAALDNLVTSGEVKPAVADAIRVIALTGARRGEISALKWSYVDLERGLITLPPAAHKTGRKTGKPRIIGLPGLAQEIIKRQPRYPDVEWVFSPSSRMSTGKGVVSGPISLSKPWRKIRYVAELPQELGLHGLRHSLASHMAMKGASATEIMTALGHRQLSTAQRYIHWVSNSRQELAEKAASIVIISHAAALNAEKPVENTQE